MTDSFLDHLPSYERRKLRKMMSAEAYERLREKVKGPEDLERELKRAEGLAELGFELQTDEQLREKLKHIVEKDLHEQGIDTLFDAEEIPENIRSALEQGKFALAVSSHPRTHEDQLVAVPEGNVHEKVPLTRAFTDRYVAQFVTSASPDKKLRDLSLRRSKGPNVYQGPKK